MKQGTWIVLVVIGLLASGCADLGRAGAKMHGLTVVGAEDCRHAFHQTPCQTVEPPK